VIRNIIISGEVSRRRPEYSDWSRGPIRLDYRDALDPITSNIGLKGSRIIKGGRIYHDLFNFLTQVT